MKNKLLIYLDWTISLLFAIILYSIGQILFAKVFSIAKNTGKICVISIFIILLLLVFYSTKKAFKFWHIKIDFSFLKNKKFYRDAIVLFISMKAVPIVYGVITNALKTTHNQAILNNAFDNNLASKMYVVLLAIFIAPLVEEFIFRRMCFNYLKKVNTPVWLIIVLTSLLFTLAHGGLTVSTLMAYFPIGLALSIIYQRYGYGASVTLHFLNNFLAIVLMFLFYN